MLTRSILEKILECQKLRDEYMSNLKSYGSASDRWYVEQIPERRIELALLRDAYEELSNDSRDRYQAECIKLAVLVINAFSGEDVQIELDIPK